MGQVGPLGPLNRAVGPVTQALWPKGRRPKAIGHYIGVSLIAAAIVNIITATAVIIIATPIAAAIGIITVAIGETTITMAVTVATPQTIAVTGAVTPVIIGAQEFMLDQEK